MTWELHRHDARRISELLEPDSVDLICCSPPYFALRSYRDDGEHFADQLGSEATPTEFVDNLIACTADWLKVLKPTGSLFVNLGDKFAGSGGHNNNGLGKSTLTRHGSHDTGGPYLERARATRRNAPDRYNQASDGIPAKSRMALPWRYAIRCIDELGLILRADIIWCLSGGARVYARTKTGDRPIMLRDLVRAYRPDDVQLWNGEKWTQVLGWNLSTDTDDALELELRSGERIGCTRGHRWPTPRGVVRADEIAIGDVIDTCRLPAGQRLPDMLPDDDIGWFVGLYLAEGSRSGTTIQIAGHLDETERHGRLAALAAAYDGTCNVYQTSENGSTCNLHAPVLAGILDRYTSPGTAHTKRLTVHAWQRSDDFLAAIVTGYLEGDGHYDAKNDRWRLGFTHNDELAADLRTLAARLGAVLSLRRMPNGWHGEWRWNVSDHWNVRPCGEVVAIRASRARQFFDVGVADEPHLFALASGVLTHNSKPNGLPESVTDRVRISHEYLFHFTKQGRYFAAIDEVREAHLQPLTAAEMALRIGSVKSGLTHSGTKPSANDGDHGHGRLDEVSGSNPLGKVPGSVWTIPSEPLTVPDHLGVDHFACVDDETEILTRRGWLRRVDLRRDDEVAGTNLDTGMTSWTAIHGIHQYDYDGELVTADARGLSMRLTPNHRTVVHRFAGRHRARQPVEVIDAADLTKMHAIPRAVEWVEDGREKAIGVDLAALLGWVAAEGWYAGRRVLLSQSLTANPDKVAAIDALATRLDGEHLRTVRERTWRGLPVTDVQWRLGYDLAAIVQATMPDKLLPNIDLPLAEARALVDAFVDGDGHRRADGRLSVFQKYRHNLDVIQGHAVQLGYNATLAKHPTRWVLYLNPPRPARLRRSDGTSLVGREHYRGVVWCVTTGTGTFVARHRGTVFVTGNSFPSELPRRIILGWTPTGWCTACGEARRAVVDRSFVLDHVQRRTRGRMDLNDDGSGRSALSSFGITDESHVGHYDATITGYVCACANTDAPTRSAVVLDPFSGTGTTPAVAHLLGRHGVGTDLSADYLRLAEWRCTSDQRLRDKVLDRSGIPNPDPPAIDGQLDLFGGVA